MEVFGAYSRYYDLLYRDKDYPEEAAYVIGLIKCYGMGVQSILELGSGTGRHAEQLAHQGYTIHGIERSSEMLTESLRRQERLPPSVASHLTFEAGDIRDYRADAQYDAVISLFHVVSYLTLNADIQKVFRNTRDHLKPGGLFLFDVWYGPAVIQIGAETRAKHLQDDAIKVLRLAEPVVYLDQNCIDVNYTVLICDRLTGHCTEMRETHKMRYLFTPEIELFLDQADMQLLHHEEWLVGSAPGASTWGVCYVARRKTNQEESGNL
ncbi:MAG: class I SAM-dependent methyltransferase [Spirochaetales bacterium]|nr:class I SAM-dependent methyltransferase [Spirochaetales bacterium]